MLKAVVHSSILVSSLWRVFLITLFSQTDMPSLTTVTLDKSRAFKEKKTVHTKSSSSSPASFLDITPALQQYLSFPLSFIHNSKPIRSSRSTTLSHPLNHIHIYNPYQASPSPSRHCLTLPHDPSDPPPNPLLSSSTLHISSFPKNPPPYEALPLYSQFRHFAAFILHSQ